MDDRIAIEQTVRAYIERRETSELQTGFMRDWARLGEAHDAWDFRRRTYRIERLRVTAVDGDSATVDLDASVFEAFEHRTGMRSGVRVQLDGARLVREDGVWKIADLRRNGRWLEDTLFVGPSGAQEIDRLRVAARMAYLGHEETRVVLEATNGRPYAARLKAASIGSRARGRWRWHGAGLYRDELEPGETATVAVVSRGSVPPGTKLLRLILPERGRRGGFDVTVQLEPQPDEVEVLQAPPRSLPFRAALARTHVVALVAMVLAAGFIVWLGQPRTAGLYLLAFVAVAGFMTVRACRGVMRRAWRALGVCAAFAVAGALLAGSETFLPGCRDADAARAADAFIEAAAAGDVRKASGWLGEDAPQLRPVHAMPRATRARLPGSRVEGADQCRLFWLAAPSRPAHRRCFGYGVEGGSATVMVLVGRSTCRWRVYATI